ncbi:type I-E CRISPR-associated protein Cas6/Cse3/CasE [Methanococcoides burtonii]|uniref:CRISPR-associated protein n=1 Tax=Methanococcoides burtonii (strain DSM 6242 / NBRC 107633 / OCM 468 / ACE-M) TaxID=259564 RepID=Q12YA7_METBU|nr:type I-E CRISPR-associated protein Cas6/Cse3/CasE [Methanococcoides burtonii]ABE51569.1 CRISPR-associated protein [Methanococcoides burtonii DSM 6242]
MSRAKLLPEAMSSKAIRGNMGNEHNVHRLVWSLFPVNEDDKRKFIYRQDSMGSLPSFYLVSENEPIDELNVWDIDVKQYDPILKSGQKLAFSLRANPIVSKRDENDKQHRHDVVMDEKFRLKMENGGDIEPNMPDIVQRKGSEWLLRKGDMNGFSINAEQIRVDAYQNHKLFKPKGKHHVSFSTVDIVGTLTVTDPDIFRDALFKGIGPAKGFGCGMLLVRPLR